MYLKLAGITLNTPDRSGYCGSCFMQGMEVQFWKRKPSMIPRLLAIQDGAILFDAGITGTDMVLQSGCKNLQEVQRFCYSSKTPHPARWVIAGRGDRLGGQSLPKETQSTPLRIGCEWTNLACRLLETSSIASQPIEHVLLDGDEETAIFNGLCDWIIVVTETGNSIQKCGLEVKEELMESHPALISRHDCNEPKLRVVEGITSVLLAAEQSIGRVMVTFDIPIGRIGNIAFPDYVISPSISPLIRENWEAGEVCIKRTDLISVLPALKTAGATAIVVSDVHGFLD